MNTNDTTNTVRQHYGATGLVDRIKTALAAIVPEDRPLTVAQLAPLDQFHVRGIQATAELGAASGVERRTRVLDLGAGLGGPARSLASEYGCAVTGVDLSPEFVDASNYLTARCGLSDRVTFRVGDALHLPFEAGSFDAVFLQHVAMNIEDRVALYAEVRRVLTPGGRFATYDIVLRDGDVVYPTPWARDASTSFLRSEADTRAAVEQARFEATLWRDDTQTVREWFQATMSNPSASPSPSGPGLGVVMGPDFPMMAANLARNIRENRLGVLSAVLTRS